MATGGVTPLQPLHLKGNRMTFRLTPEQIEPAWATLKIEIVFNNKTGELKPWEMWGCFTYPHKMRKHWGSFKTEEAANKKLKELLNKYPQAR